MQLDEIREALYSRLELDPSTTTEFVSRLDRHINDAIRQMATDLPFSMHTKRVRYFTQPTVEMGSTADTIYLSTALTDGNEDWPSATFAPQNPWVFRTTLPVGSDGATAWRLDRTWDGREIEIITEDNTVFRNVIRHVWREVDKISGADEYRFSVVTPWPHEELGTGPFRWRILGSNLILPQDMISLKDLRINDRQWTYDIEVLEPQTARNYRWEGRNVTNGIPRRAYRDMPYVMEAPSIAPDAAQTVSAAEGEWAGPEPFGQFEYKITYSWGKQDSETAGPSPGLFRGSAGTYSTRDTGAARGVLDYYEDRLKLPRFESGPSPASAAVSVVPDSESGRANAVKLTLPNIEYVLGFFLQGLFGQSVGPEFSRSNSTRSGWVVNIYRRRITADFTSYDTFNSTAGVDKAQILGLTKIDIRNRFYLLASVQIDENNAGVFIDDGTILPDMHRPLTSTGLHVAAELYPHADERYAIELDYVPIPRKVADDTDPVPVDPAAKEALVESVLYRVQRMMGDPQWSATQASYEGRVEEMRKAKGSLQPGSQVARKRSGRRGRNRYRTQGPLGISETG